MLLKGLESRKTCNKFIIWSHIIDRHRTASISPNSYDSTASSRWQKESYDFCHLFRHRMVPGEVKVLLEIPQRPTAFSWANETKMTSVGHHAMSGKRQELSKIS